MTEAQEFFYAECASRARELPLTEAVKFLHGMSLSCGDAPADNLVAKILIALSESDRQLELIQTGQLKLEFSTKEANQ